MFMAAIIFAVFSHIFKRKGKYYKAQIKCDFNLNSIAEKCKDPFNIYILKLIFNIF